MISKTKFRIEGSIVLITCAALSALAAYFSWRLHALLNYGDAVAHLHIARRLFDSHQPGFEQLGSVWLPVPHIVLLPFVTVYAWWANGIAGLIPSSLTYLVSCLALYLLARKWMARIPASIALLFFALNPNLLYLQTTAMTEPLFLCEILCTVLFLVEWRMALDEAPERCQRLQWVIALLLVAAILTRYDGWILALLAWTAMGLTLLRRDQFTRGFWLASAVVVAAPIFWFAYNAIAFGDWLAFIRGPYSAKAIEMRTMTPGSGPPHPGWHNPWVALLFYVKSAMLDATCMSWGSTMVIMVLLGVRWALKDMDRKGYRWSLLLWLPVPFYAYSVAWGSVPIFIPIWWPHSYYNTRYGMELLPAFALSLGFAAHGVIRVWQKSRLSFRITLIAPMFLLLGLNAMHMLKEGPLTYIEGTKNVESRRTYEATIPPALRAALATHPGGEVLMNSSYNPQLIALTGIPLRQTINEGDFHTWENALSNPADRAAFVLAFDGDQVDQAVHAHPANLELIGRFSAPWQPSASLYRSTSPAINKAQQR